MYRYDLTDGQWACIEAFFPERSHHGKAGHPSNFRLSEKARQMEVGGRGFLRFAKLSRCDRSRV